MKNQDGPTRRERLIRLFAENPNKGFGYPELIQILGVKNQGDISHILSDLYKVGFLGKPDKRTFILKNASMADKRVSRKNYKKSKKTNGSKVKRMSPFRKEIVNFLRENGDTHYKVIGKHFNRSENNIDSTLGAMVKSYQIYRVGPGIYSAGKKYRKPKSLIKKVEYSGPKIEDLKVPTYDGLFIQFKKDMEDLDRKKRETIDKFANDVKELEGV